MGRITAYSHLIWFFECFIIPMFLLSVFNNTFQRTKIELTFVILGSIASAITLFLIINPNINSIIRTSIIIDTLDTISTYDWSFRGFSFAEGSSYSYGIVQGLILGLCLLELDKKSFYIIPVILLFISIMFNARIGFVPVIISSILFISNKKIKLKSTILIIGIFVIGYWTFSISSFSQNNETSLNWGLSFFEDTFRFLKGENNDSNYSALTGNMFFLPNDLLSIIFGTGQDIYQNTSKTSDIGYVLQIYRGGIIYLSIMLLFLMYMFKRNYTANSNKIITILFIITILVVNFKGNAFFISNGFFRLFSLYYIHSVYNAININKLNQFKTTITLTK